MSAAFPWGCDIISEDYRARAIAEDATLDE
jgi:hypothetical protein